MSSQKSQELIACVPVADVDDPIAKSRQDNCQDCGRDIWVSIISDEYMAERRHRLVCLQCFDKYGITPTNMKDDIPTETKEALLAEGIDVDEIYGD